ncbi:ADP-ribosylglycohydrolase family protein [Nocardiopsis ganjiahuensis]|uniref:ADP-ribosylglycohydrolase family protein n=1 Tax=Nocardiopsis ganjiahuensis TaxID=239984 RepID=UPI0003497E8F|nr:ADP-ribosylglycohydrolase family protein [Nocardiopsis ganjiahuensis]
MHTPSPVPDRLTGCLMGGAIGDALGAPVEGLGLDQIHERYGPRGLTEYAEGSYGVGAITDETQLTLRTADALIRASVRERDKGIGGAAVGMVQTAYLGWVRIHRDGTEPGPSAGTAPAPAPAGGPRAPLAFPDPLDSPRGYGAATVAALREAEARKEPGRPLGTVEEPVNNSKGCAAVVRVAPCGFGAGKAEYAFDLAVRVAALTHGHRTAQLAAGVFAATVWGLVRDGEIADSLGEARGLLEGRSGHEEVSRALDAAVETASRGVPTAWDLAGLGDGWTSEEALAVAACVALRAEDLASPATAPVLEPGYSSHRGIPEVGRYGLRLAVNHSGDSDSIGALCGSLIGARYGVHAFPGHWQSQLEVRERVIGLAADAALEFGPCPPSEPAREGVHGAWAAAHSGY